MTPATKACFPLVILLAACGTAGTGAANPPAIDGGTDAGTCGGGGLRPGSTTGTVQPGGGARDYIVHVPPSYDGTRAVPLVLDIHGLTSNASQQQLLSGWRQKAD